MTKTIWLTGLSGAGKSTLAKALAVDLLQKGRPCYIVDGDELRSGLCSDLRFSREDRGENIRRAAEVCRLLNAANVVAIAALISPYQQDREKARHIVGAQAFQEVWVSTSLAVCEQRDVKGLYKRARSGELASFTGISDLYESPRAPILALDTHMLSVADCVKQLNKLIELEGPWE